MIMDLPDAHSTRRPQELAEQVSPGPPMQESELGHGEAGGRLSGTRAKGPENEARRTPERVQSAIEAMP